MAVAETNKRTKIIRENHLDFLYDLHLRGVSIGSDNITLLRDKGYLENESKSILVKKEKSVEDVVNSVFLNKSSDKQKEVDSKIDISISNEALDENNYEIITNVDLEERRQKHGHIFEGRKTEIQSSEWLPQKTTVHTQDFIDFINSINHKGFDQRIQYRKFNLYCQQAYTWLQDKTSRSDFLDEDGIMAYEDEEIRRCDENSLYFLNKYVYYKEGDSKTGKVKYVANPAHELMAFLNDSGYSVGIAKGRQMAATTTLMALDVKDVIFKTNHFMKFITEDVEKAEEIFEDKLKFAFAELPQWMRPNVLNERDNVFKIGYKSEKGKKEGVGSKIMVSAPKRTAIAGGAPQKVKIDEAGNIPLLGQMIDNARPTMLWTNPETRELEIKRRLWFWGTGGQMEKGGKAFETEFMALIKQWQEGIYSSAIVPVFFNWTCRTGATIDDYNREKAVAYSKEGPDAKKSITEFHQSWPASISDVFRSSSKTLVDDDYIEQALERIRKAKREHKFQLHQSGYFEPIYDSTQTEKDGSDTPYRIIGANFVPTSDIDQRASVTIFLQPDYTWTNRYFQGTDPIDTDTGLSNMASTIWDKHFKCPAAILNWRTRDYKQVFLQTMLLGLYYDEKQIKTGVRELVESNRGTSYTQYKTEKGFGKWLVLNYQLPFAFQNKTTINEGIGIDNKGLRNTMIINNLHTMISGYGDRIFLDIFFEQLKTFTCNMSERGKEMWGPMNKKYFQDDTLFSTTFAYICAEQCFPSIEPVNTQKKSSGFKIVYKTHYDSNNKLSRVAVKVRT